MRKRRAPVHHVGAQCLVLAPARRCRPVPLASHGNDVRIASPIHLAPELPRAYPRKRTKSTGWANGVARAGQQHTTDGLPTQQDG
jgi:hypothetical protein